MGCGQSAAHSSVNPRASSGTQYRLTNADEARAAVRIAAQRCKLAAFARLDENPSLSEKEREQLRQVLNRRSVDKIYKTKKFFGALTDVADAEDPTHFLVYDSLTTDDSGDGGTSIADPGATWDTASPDNCRLRSPRMPKTGKISVAAPEINSIDDSLLATAPPPPSSPTFDPNVSTHPVRCKTMCADPDLRDPLVMLLAPEMILNRDVVAEDASSGTSLKDSSVRRSLVSPLPRESASLRYESSISTSPIRGSHPLISPRHDASITAKGALQQWSRSATANNRSSGQGETPSCSAVSVTRSVTFHDDVSIVYFYEGFC